MMGPRFVYGCKEGMKKIYQWTLDKQTVYLKSVVSNPNIEVGDYTMRNEIITEKYE